MLFMHSLMKVKIPCVFRAPKPFTGNKLSVETILSNHCTQCYTCILLVKNTSVFHTPRCSLEIIVETMLESSQHNVINPLMTNPCECKLFSANQSLKQHHKTMLITRPLTKNPRVCFIHLVLFSVHQSLKTYSVITAQWY